MGIILKGTGINLGTASFRKMIEGNSLYIDKTKFIEHFLMEKSDVQLIVRQRRLGKSLNLDMLRCFLTDLENNEELFRGLYIENSSVKNQRNCSPVFLFDFKNLNEATYQWDIVDQIEACLLDYLPDGVIPDRFKRRYDRMIRHPETFTGGLRLLTEIIYHVTGKRSYLLIDEYDQLITKQYDQATYQKIEQYETDLLSAGLKGNDYLEKALITGVIRISRESFFSGLNNIQTYDVFSDHIFTQDFGLNNGEIDELNKFFPFDKEEIRLWYNGIKVNGRDIYNIYSVLSFVASGRYDNYWGRSGTLDTITGLLTDSRREAIAKLLNGEAIKVFINQHVSYRELQHDNSDDQFYSLLVQSGYLSLESEPEPSRWFVKIPGKELMNVWKDYILSSVVHDNATLITVFDHMNDLALFDKDLTYFINDRLSFHDLDFQSQERDYHIFVLGLLSGYEDIRYHKPLSNRESGDGRYDIMFERAAYSIIFELKAVKKAADLESAVINGLKQIDEKRYFAEAPRNKRVIKTAIAFCGKHCIVKSAPCNLSYPMIPPASAGI